MLLSSTTCAAQAQARRQRRVLRSAAATSSAPASTHSDTRSLADYTRLEEQPGGDLVLQTAVVRLEAPRSSPLCFWEQPAVCDLVAAVHIADAAYFERLQRELDSGYDEVLYELVADQTKTPVVAGQRWRPPPPSERRRPTGAVSRLQTTVARALSLSFQLEQVDMSGDTWVHADLTLARFLELQRASGESLLTLVGSMYSSAAKTLWKELTAPLPEALAAGGLPAELRHRLRKLAGAGLLPMPLLLQVCLLHLLSLDAPSTAPLSQAGPLGRALRSRLGAAGWAKALLAEGLTRRELSSGGALSGSQARSSVVLGARNDAALAELDLAVGRRGAKRVALFYGAAHLPDLEAELAGRGWRRRGGERWMDAWHIPQRAGGGAEGLRISPAQAGVLLLCSTALGTDLALWDSAARWVAALLGQSLA